MKIAIQDANILIDLEIAGVLDLWFQMGIETHTTDLVIRQLDRERHAQTLSYVDAGLLHVWRTGGEDLESIVRMLATLGGGLEIEDVSVLFWAERTQATILTGDKELSRAAKRRGVEVHGTLWILDHLLDRKLLHPGVAADRLERLMREDRRLPVDECHKRMTAWRGSALTSHS